MPSRPGILSRDIWSLRHELSGLLSHDPVRIVPGRPSGCDALVGWADARGRASRFLAGLLRVPFLPVIEGPLRGVEPGQPPASLRLLGREPPGRRVGEAEAERGLAQLRRLRLAGRNDGRDRLPPGLAPGGFALVIARGGEGLDPSRVLLGQAGEGPVAVVADTREPADVARAVAAGRPDAVAVAGTNPWALFDGASRILADGGELAGLARIAGHPVEGLDGSVRDEGAALFRRGYLEDAAWFDAWSRAPTDFATAADQLAWLRDRFLENDRRSHCLGVSRWKRAAVARFLRGPDGPPSFHGTAEEALRAAARDGGRVVAWETRTPRGLAERCREAGTPLHRMEDGFLRSVGLGASFLPGASAVLDETGIYYDPRGPSDLERILAETAFAPELLRRAAALRQEVVALRLSKYNVGREGRAAPFPAGRPVVLVPGQVEDDASIQLGSRLVRRNLDLLRAARERHPDAFLVYKPHPDVAAGLRRGAVAPADALRLADRVIADEPIAALLDRVDAVETMTSLAGFEALLRGKAVATHGRPFYSGWGLTTDLDPDMPRRGRALALDALVAGALILYPRSVDPVSGRRCPPEILVRRLAAGRDAARDASAPAAALRAGIVRARHALLTPLGAALRRARGGLRDTGGGDPAA